MLPYPHTRPCDAVAPAQAAWLLRRADGDGPAEGSPADDARVEDREQSRRAIVCAACQHPVTDEEAQIDVAGRHGHTCVNPSGYVYRIRCFRRAPGCVGVGSWSSLYAWFAGHAWQVACCSSCSIHLGWAFEPEAGATGPENRFYGLIVDRLAEAEQGGPGDA